MSRIIHADHVVRGDAPPLRDGAIVVDDRGTVIAVGPAAEVLVRHEGARVERVRGVVFPGLVNAHTHVELSALRGRVPGGRGFVPWVSDLVAHRSETTEEESDEAIARAADELVASATVAVGDVSNSLGAVQALAARGMAGVIFHEVFGLERAAVMRRLDGLQEEVRERVATWPSPDLAYTPAPHTLYTVHQDALAALLGAAKARGLRTSLHLAEHPAERRAIEHGDGPFVAWVTKQTKLRNDAALAPSWPSQALFDYAARVGALDPSVMLVHLAEARPDELARVAAAGAPVVSCPRSNLFIENRLPPLLAFRQSGIEAALGTDSLASNASLDVLAEAKALADRFPTVGATELVTMATWNGARALGRSDLGRIAPGARPGIFAVDGAIEADACAFLLANLRAPRRLVVKRAAEREA